MRKIDFAALVTEGVNVTCIAAVERKWKGGNSNRYPDGRAENILSYTLRGDKRIQSAGEQEVCLLSAPATVLIARNTPYTSTTELPEEEEWGHTICVRFTMVDDRGEDVEFAEPFRYWRDDPDGHILTLYRALLDAYLAPNSSSLLLRARLLELLHTLSATQEERRIPPQFRQLVPAVRYMEKHPAENLSVADLAAMCFLSESYFRSRFREFSGCSPTDYRNRLRIAKAKELLASSLWTTDLVAEALGFYDTSHFYRVYKKMTGITPRGEKKED